MRLLFVLLFGLGFLLPATNAAVSGTRMRDLLSQVETLSPTVDYVTILMGGNDLCGPTEA